MGHAGKRDTTIEVTFGKSFMCEVFTKHVHDGISGKECGVLVAPKNDVLTKFIRICR